jgi:hypothetical protein
MLREAAARRAGALDRSNHNQTMIRPVFLIDWM